MVRSDPRIRPWPLHRVMLSVDRVQVLERMDDRFGEPFDDIRIAHRTAKFFDVRDQDGRGEREDLVAIAADVFWLCHGEGTAQRITFA